MNNIASTTKQSTFVAQHELVWQEFDQLCQKIQKRTWVASQNAQERYLIVRLYRQICAHYTLASQRHYSPLLVEELRARVALGHRLIYGHKKSYSLSFVRFVFDTFPNAVRAQAGLFWLCFGLFYIPYGVMLFACYVNGELIYSILPAYEVMRMEQMYNPELEHVGRSAERASDTDLMMFGHYVQNNIGIDFKVYAMGVFFGLGSIFVTMYNGVILGAVSGHLTNRGLGADFWQFVAGHSALELTAIVISCMAGLNLATPLIAPAPYSRKDAFLVSGKKSVVLILGAALMTLLAAFVEAFWSATTVLYTVKYIVGVFFWVLVAGYLLFCGKKS